MTTVVKTIKYKSKSYKAISTLTIVIGVVALIYSMVFASGEPMYLFFSVAIILVGAFQLFVLIKDKLNYDNLSMPTALILDGESITAINLSNEVKLIKFLVADIVDISKFTKTDIKFTIKNSSQNNIECSFSPIEFSNLKRHLRPLLSIELKEKLSGGVNVDAFENL